MPTTPGEPQPGILPEPGSAALFLVLRVVDPARDAKAVGKVLAGVPGAAAKLAATERGSRLVANVGIGSDFWDLLSPDRRPAGLRRFRSLEVAGRRAPATDGDALIHLVSRRHDLNVELAMQIRAALGDRVEVMDEVHGFKYRDGRDLTGFLDGTENPKGKARAAVALVGDEDRAFAGGSYVFTQRYVHDLAKWATLGVKEQEGVVGRRKADSVELSDAVKPPTAHIARTVIEENGEELEIVRHSFPYGTTSERGLFFIAYCRTLDIPERMLARMVGATDDGLHDRLLEFAHAVSGAYFFAPSLRVLRRLG
jgi:putative iron-dependent peroxidase